MSERLINRAFAYMPIVIPFLLAIHAVSGKGHHLQPFHWDFFAALRTGSITMLLEEIEGEIYRTQTILGALDETRMRLDISHCARRI
jgi:hypothetical protein